MKKGSFFRRLTGSIKLSDEEDIEEVSNTDSIKGKNMQAKNLDTSSDFDFEEEEEEGQLTIDMYETQREIVVQAMIAGVQPDNLNITITRDSIVIKGKREEPRGVDEEAYAIRELYWGSFSRTMAFPKEVEAEEAEALEKHGLLTIKIPKIDKDKKTSLKVKSL